ncbi:zf-TFIIB domain-containing protein [Actinomadura sp. ATCC 31491]|uniref:Zf-TFIIB domain-containing protein n=1 Tax=Actinomadura luzonensis TaxID=2805427 RepID=A0ABT0G408_9ACTN|nr:zf-TFIIB domain-containing protein [Actinomadura luzonensis]MCK2218878.1 zf-TFIIB domain-containing protein [Actinomadura luzonensis]
MQCPKCRGNMRTYERNGVHIEQCDNCRGIFLDYGELETLTRMESQYHAAPPPPPAPGPAWGAPSHGGYHHGGHHRQRSWVGMLFST